MSTPSPTKSTGGGGFVFESRVVAFYLSAMLARAAIEPTSASLSTAAARFCSYREKWQGSHVMGEFSYGMIRGDRDEGGVMAPIVNSIEISRRPEDVFTYLTNPSHLPDWQESAVSVWGDAPLAVGSRVVVNRRVGRTERSMTNEVTELSPPKSWSLRSTDGPIRAKVKGTVEPLEDGERSRVTLALDFEGHGIGKILLPLVVRRQAQAEMPRNMQKLKELLESGA